MYTFFSISADDLSAELELGISCLVPYEKRLILEREGIIYKPNYHAMAQVAEVYYQGKEISGKWSLTFYALCVKVEEVSESFVKINGVDYYIDTIYGEPDVIGPNGYYIHVDDESKEDKPSFYTFDKVFEVFNAYVKLIKSGKMTPLRVFETELACAA